MAIPDDAVAALKQFSVRARPVERVVVPVGGTDREFLAQQRAAEFAAAFDLPVRALHVATGPEEIEDDVFRFIHELCEKHGVENDCQVVIGDDPVVELRKELGPLDLVVVGTRRLGTRFHLSSIVERLIGSAPCMVQVVRLDP